MTDADSGKQGVLDRLVLFSGLLCLLALGAFASQPLDRLFPPTQVELTLTALQPNGGPCYVLRHDLGVTSDAGGGFSLVQLFENDTPLEAHASHQVMRDGLLGSFSHWNQHLYFTSTDGSDPRSNGRRYHAKLPVALPAWLDQALFAALIGGVALVLLGLVLARVRRRSLLADAVPLLAAAGVAWVLLPVDAWIDPLNALRRAERQLEPDAPANIAQAATRPGNVTRLLPMSEAASFEAFGELPASDQSLRVPLTPSEGVAIQNGVARLEPGGPGLVGRFEPALPVSAIGEILLPARVLEGHAVEVGLRADLSTVNPQVQIDVPVTPSPELRPLRVLNPLSLHVGDQNQGLLTVEVRNPHTATRAVMIELSEVVFASPATSFLRETHGTRDLALNKNLRPTSWQSVPGRFRLPLEAAQGSLLKGAVGLFGSETATKVPYTVTWVDTQGAETVVLAGELGHDNRWHDLRTTLARDGAESRGGELLLEVGALPAGTAFGWSGWRLVDDSRAPQRVIVMLLDTLRRDALGVFGGVEAHTPFLDELARGGVRFNHCYSQAHWTRPSMPSLMSSRYVAATGVESIGKHLPERYVTLAEAYADAGFYTLADIANTNAGPSAGLQQGWDQMQHFADPSASSSAGQLVDSDLLARVQGALEEDLVLYVHLMEAHGPYGPGVAPSTPDVGAHEAPLDRDHALDRPWVATPTAGSRRHWYFRDVESMDAGIASFFSELDAIWGEGATEAATLAVTADHGEYLGEHGQWGHGWFRLLPEVVNVPMFVRAPSLPRNLLIETPVENIDLGPSMLELAGISASALGEVDGRSLLPLILQGDRSAHGLALSAVGHEKSKQLSLYGSGSALLGDEGRLIERIVVEGEVREQIDLTRANSSQSVLDARFATHLDARFKEVWDRYLDSRGKVREAMWVDVDDADQSVDPLALKQLEELGYLGG